MYDFNYHRPATLAQAKRLLAKNDEAKLIAGGMTLLPAMKMRLAQPSDLIDLAGIGELTGISDTGNEIGIGAMVRHADVAASGLVRQAIPALAELAGLIGDAQVRNRGTLGGSIASSDPAADYPAAVLGLNAVIKTDRREIAADEFFLGMFETALAADEVIVSVRFPKHAKAAYARFPNPASRYAVVGVMIAKTEGELRVAVTGAGACVFRPVGLEDALANEFSAKSINGLKIDVAKLNSDLHATAEYRAHLVVEMAKRACKEMGG